MEELLQVLYFSAPWCGPCKMFGPAFDEVVAKFGDEIVVSKINVDEKQEVAADYAIRSIPTVIMLKGKNELFRHTGVMPKNHLEDLIKIKK